MLSAVAMLLVAVPLAVDNSEDKQSNFIKHILRGRTVMHAIPLAQSHTGSHC